MKEALSVICVIIPVLFIVFEFASYVVYGKILKNKDVDRALDFHIQKGSSLNPYSSGIINIGDMPFISTVRVPTLAMYYIDDVGRVSIFSSAHRRIRKIHKQLLSEVEVPTIEEKLKIK